MADVDSIPLPPPERKFHDHDLLSMVEAQNRDVFLEVFLNFAEKIPTSEHRIRLKHYPNTFTSEDAIDAFRTATPGFNREDAVTVLSRCVEGRLLRSPDADDVSDLLKSKHVYMLGRKAKMLLASDRRILVLNWISGRCVTDFELLFIRFIGDTPNESGGDKDKATPDSGLETPPLSGPLLHPLTPLPGIALRDRMAMLKTYSHCCSGQEAITHLLETTTAMSRMECLDIADHFIQNDWLRTVDEGDVVFRDNKNIIYQVTETGAALAGWPEAKWPTVRDFFSNMSLKKKLGPLGLNNQSGEDLAKSRVQSPRESSEKFDHRPYSIEKLPSDPSGELEGIGSSPSSKQTSFLTADGDVSDAHNATSRRSSHRRMSFGASPAFPWETAKETHVSRLTTILTTPAVRNQFVAFVATLFCEENLEFVVDAERFRLCYDKEASIASLDSVSQEAVLRIHSLPSEDAEKLLIAHAIGIFLRYMTRMSPRELNLPSKVIRDVSTVVQSREKYFDLFDSSLIKESSPIDPFDERIQKFISSAPEACWEHQDPHDVGFNATMFSSAEAHIFQVIAGDSVPKFIKTEEYKILMYDIWERGELPVQSKRASILARMSLQQSRKSDLQDSNAVTEEERGFSRDNLAST
ncbi:hypothetical protein DFS34DRAFT_653380 [Phlyctochytrium arcticum]|nr:hypothetical protein DFS34DRAFT_653380 [Phlyctochytrium arcticum]